MAEQSRRTAPLAAPMAAVALVALVVVGAARAGAPESAPVKAGPGARPVIEDAGKAWIEFLRTAESQQVGNTNDVLNGIYAGDGPNAETCQKNLGALDRALAINPVGVALWNTAYRCAKLLGDEPLAATYYESLAKLATHALGQSSDALDADPIPVTSVNDINALLQVSGMDVRYSYIDPRSLKRFYAIHVAAWDDDAKAERHLSFDFLQTMASIARKNRYFGYPALRITLRNSYMQSQTKAGTLMGVDLSAVFASTEVDDAKAKVNALRDAGVAGGVVSGEVWLDTCAETPFPECGSGLVDALLPFAEKHYVSYTLNLALAYSLGIGVKRDEDNAMTLLDVATKECASDRAVMEYSRHFAAIRRQQAFTKPLLARLKRVAEHGNLEAAGLIALHDVDVSTDRTMTPAQVKAMTALAARGYSTAYSMLATYHDQRSEPAEAISWRRKAAEADETSSQSQLAFALRDGNGVPKDVVAGERWMLRAASAGDRDAMMQEGWLAERHQDWKAAEAWFVSAAQFGSNDGAIALADLFADGHPGVEQDLPRAVAILEGLTDAATPDGALARRSLASVLVRRATGKDPGRAIKLLQQDADKGDVASQFDLALGYLDGTFGSVDTAKGDAWMAKVQASDQKEYHDAYANWLFAKGGSADSRSRALAIWQKLVAGGLTISMNNLAWARCTSPDAAVRNGGDGLKIALQMGEASTLSGAAIDTQAACEAAVGHFDRAAELQVLAISESGFVAEEAERRKDMESRLALYRGHHDYIQPDTKK